MRKTNSTAALTEEDHRRQDELYIQSHEYDYFIIGSGNAALTVGSLLANQGYKVCIAEAHDTPGGYAHTFTMGDYSFCAQVHYIWGCGPGRQDLRVPPAHRAGKGDHLRADGKGWGRPRGVAGRQAGEDSLRV